MRHSKILTAMTGTAIIMAGCQQNVDVLQAHPEDAREESTLRVIVTSESQETRSSFSWDDSRINDLQIIVTQIDGEMVESIYVKKTTEIEFHGIIGTTYQFRAVANVGHELSGNTLEDFLSSRLAVNFGDIEHNGIPMACSGAVTFTIKKNEDKLTIPMKRLLARIDFSIDKSHLKHADARDGFTVKSVKVFNAINSYKPFAEVNRQVERKPIDYSFDYASEADIEGLNSGRNLSLYAFENMQGDLLRDNDDPWRKIPGNISDSEFCTYLEVEASYHAQGLSSEAIYYRMYIGKDATCNFDVMRNTIYSITLSPTEEEMDGHRASWKIDSQDWDDWRELRFSPGSIEIPSGKTGVVHVFTAPERFETMISQTEWLKDAGCDINYDDLTHDITITGHTRLIEDITGIIRVDSWDRRLSDTCRITLKKATNPVVDIYLKGQSRKDIFISDCSIVMQQGKRLGILDAGITYVFEDGTEHTVTSLDDELFLKTRISLTDLSSRLCFTYKENTLASYDYADAGESGTLLFHFKDSESDFSKNIDLLIVDRKFVQFITAYTHYVEVGNTAYIHLYASYEDGFRFEPSTVAFDYIYLDIPEEYSDIARPTRYTTYIGVEGLSIGTCPAQLVFKTKPQPVRGFPVSKEYSLPTNIVVHDGGTMTLEPEYQEIKVGDSYELVAKVYPDWDSDRFVYVDPEYVSSDENVAVVSSDGIVTGIGPGSAVISASFYGEESHYRQYTCNAMVKVLQDEIISYYLELSNESLTMKKGDEASVKVFLHTITNGMDDGGQDITNLCSWSSSDKGIAHISLGRITAVSTGDAEIIAEYNGMRGRIAVTVIDDSPELTFTYELVIPERLDMGLGEKAEMKAYLVKHTFVSGKESGTPAHYDVSTDCKWNISDPAVAEISPIDGIITAKKAGTAVINAVYEDDSTGRITSNTCTVRISGDSGLGVKISWGNHGNTINIGF